MKKFLLISIFLIFVSFWGAPKSALAETSSDGCVSWNFQCVDSSSVTADLSWRGFYPQDIPEGLPHPSCTFSEINYTVEVVNIGEESAGSSPSYSWTNLATKTIYQWKVTVWYQGVAYYCPTLSGSASTDIYSFTTPSCDDPNSNPPIADAGPDKEVGEEQQVVLEGSGEQGASCSEYFCGEPDGQGGCKPRAAGEYGLPVCQRCNGVSLVPVNFANNTRDTEGSNLCNQTCKRCSGGNCVNQTSSQDLFNECGLTGGCATGNCSGQGSWCGYYTSGQRNCPTCQNCVGATSSACKNAFECQNCYGCSGWCYSGICHTSCEWKYGYYTSCGYNVAGSVMVCKPSNHHKTGYTMRYGQPGYTYPPTYYSSYSYDGSCQSGYTIWYDDCICN
jgi:hypothetical protein